MKNAYRSLMKTLKFLHFGDIPTIFRVCTMNNQQMERRGIKRSVRLIANFAGLWAQTISQTPFGNCQFGSTLFKASGKADYYFIFNSTPDGTISSMEGLLNGVGPERIFGLHMEPADYIRKFGYDEFSRNRNIGRFYTNDEDLLSSDNRYIASPPYVHFHVGLSYDELTQIPPREKSIDIGVIVSDLTELAGHRKRQAFLERLDESGLNVAIWGRGDGLRRLRCYRGFVKRKWDAHSICRFSLVMENSVSKFYWSEKLADSLLSYSTPLYFGCKDLAPWLPPQAIIGFDIDDPNAISHLRRLVSSQEDDRRADAVSAARDLILREHNIYAFIDRELSALEAK